MLASANLLKLPVIIMLAVVLNACGNDQSPGQNGDTTAETPTTADETPAAESAAEATNQDTPTAATADNGNEPQSKTEDTGNTTATAEQTKAPEYEVECDADGSNCRVGMDTYIGWTTYRSQCTQCHGQDARGTTIGPNLMDRLNQRVDYPRFVDVLTNGYSGQMGVMPAWKDNKAVMDKLPNIYMYLKARADGVLDAGRPQRLE